MFLLLKDTNGKDIVVKNSEIKRVYAQGERTIISVTNSKVNGCFSVNMTVADFYNTHLVK